MPITDFLIGKRGLERQLDRTQSAIREQFDPSIVQPIVTEARTRATEGINEGIEDIARQRTIQQLFAPQDFSMFGGSAAGAIAGAQATTQGAQQALAGFESNLTAQDIATRQQGAQQFAQGVSQQRQIASTRESQLDQSEQMFEAELSRRRQKLGGAVAKLAGTALTIPFGGVGGAVGQSLAQRALGGFFGGNDSEQQPQAVSEQADLFGLLQGIENIPTGGGAVQPEQQPLPDVGIESIFGDVQTPSVQNLFTPSETTQQQTFPVTNITPGLTDDVIPSREGIMTDVQGGVSAGGTFDVSNEDSLTRLVEAIQAQEGLGPRAEDNVLGILENIFQQFLQQRQETGAALRQ